MKKALVMGKLTLSETKITKIQGSPKCKACGRSFKKNQKAIYQHVISEHPGHICMVCWSVIINWGVFQTRR